MRIAIYSRVSTLKQDTENQLVQLREFAAKQGWEVVREYVDYESGAKAERVEFQRMFEDASRRKSVAALLAAAATDFAPSSRMNSNPIRI